MPLPSWPSIAKPSHPMEESDFRGQVRTEFEGGYVQTRSRETRARKRWSLRWIAMTEADWGTLSTFFRSYLGSTFTWTHPITSASYTVRFSDDTLQSNVKIAGRREVTVNIEEV